MLGILPTHKELICSSVATLYPELAFVKRLIYILQTENTLLLKEHEELRSMIRVLHVEISVLQAILKATKDEKASHINRPEGETIHQLERRLTDYQKFVRALAEGHVFDPMIINHAQAGVDQGYDLETSLVQAIRTAALDNQSPWSKILPALVNGQVSEKHFAAANMALNMHKELCEMKRLARSWKSQALSKSITLGTMPSGFSVDKTVSGTSATMKSCLSPLAKNLGHLSTFGDFQTNGIPNSPAAQFPQVTPVCTFIPKFLDEKLTSKSLRPSLSLGLDATTSDTTLHKQVHMKYSRRMTFHDSMNLETRAIEKRRGFVMPCIVSPVCHFLDFYFKIH
jgi:hypothetical protein